jgi:arylsulfatase A-like enzyme
VGALAAGALSGALRATGDRLGGAVREAALFAPVAMVVAAVLVPSALLLSGRRVASVAAWVRGREARARYVLSVLLVAPSALVVWIALAARAGQFFMTAFHHVGLAALAQAVGLTALGGAMAAVAHGVAAVVRRALPARAHERRLFAPAVVLGLALAAALVTVGVRAGDLQGHGGWLGAYGVLRKPELDLAPVYGLGGAFALAAVLSLATARSWRCSIPLAAAAAVVAAACLRYTAHHFGDAPSAAVIDARPGLARTVLRALRRRVDRDRDGFAALFGGGDCDDDDPRRNPEAVDVPGNGLDEDCTGADAPRPPPPPAPPPSLRERLARETPADLNLVLITVDTLRWDLHYAGNPRPLSPNLDRLAAQSIVFDRGYALSSYTGRAVGPMLIGRYPTECVRDAQHFTRYPAANVFLAERLRAHGFRTAGAASHFYFEPRFGLVQGMDTWDMSARPGGEEQETTSADARVADRALTLLRAPENASQRFFLWVHFFDPHKQYVPHPEIPAFGSGERARYDAEVAWTDRQIGRLLDALDALPFARRTVVVVTADHGEAFGEHGMSWHGIELWEELVRVPWILRVPGLAPRHVTEARGQIDLVPTLLELLRVPAPSPDSPDALSGVSLVPDLLGVPQPPRPIYIELPEGPFNSLRRSVIADGWKLTERGPRRFELYHLTDDPGERTNLAPTRPDELARMRALMEQVRAGLRVVPALGEGG